VGFYPTTQLVNAEMPLRPDGFYGVSKCFGEALSRYYYDRFGIETVCLRIGSSFPEPRNQRMMTTYLAYDDLVELIRRSLFTPRVGHTITFGTSDNATRWWDNSKAAHLGYKPSHSSSEFADRFPDSAERPAPDDATSIYQGGPFVTAGPMYD
jgi:uronate dehydrogenase